MSRSFDGSGDRLVYTGVVVDTPPFTMATWFKRGAISSTQYLLNTCTQGSTNHSHRLVFNSANLLTASSTDTATSASSGHTITDTASWHHAAGVWASATSRQCYLDGTADTVNTTSRTPSGIDRFKVGAGGSEAQVFNGLIAHSAVWGVALTADEIASLAAGLSPLLIRPASLVAYWPYLGRDSTEIDIIGRYALAVTGAAASADEPRLRWPSRKRVIYVPAAGGQSASVGRSDETDTAIGLARSKSKAAQFADETDTALGLTRRKAKAAQLATETDTALALTAAHARATGLASETDSALALAKLKAKATGLASETETALALVRVKAKPVGLATETDNALAVSAVKTRSTGRADETDTALALGEPAGVGLATETDSALSLARVKAKAVEVATTTETALALTARKVRLCGTAAETDTALGLAAQKIRACGRADESDTALARPPLGVIVRPVGLAIETDEALALEPAQREEEAATGGWARYFRAEQAALRRKHLRALAEEAEEASEREALAEALETALIADGTATQGDVDRLRLDQIAALYTDRTLLDRRAQRALAYAERSRTELATRLALRELQRQQEDEELAVLLVLAID